ncbi:hypothetical protein GCG21_13710 [Pseudactinotalea sp. HY160]|uniref:hypothetical protein n=1 Tax=Pseudactinotalea sp. HY160 TaxID=2654490 RepID=UPI00128BD7A9|nr:hypothetical protein [Pseudactinotalea sp. HY160]MPV51043.1 hypothetical protein [Pseudactinotalea sp. HY160]
MPTYAKGTEVTSSRSREEIERTLLRYGADAFAYATSRERAMVEFSANGRRIRFLLPLPDPSSPQFTRTPTGRERSATAARDEWEKGTRQAWRSLALLVKAKLEAVESGIVTFEAAFLAHTVLPSGSTVADEVEPQIRDAYAGGQVAPLQITTGP